jgi:hypothetical protein
MNEMTAITQLAVTRLILKDARYEALSASGLQPPGAPTADMVIAAINCTVQQFDPGRAGRLAQDLGAHPAVTATRMRWVHGLAPNWTPGLQPAWTASCPVWSRNMTAHVSAAAAGPQALGIG